MSHLFVTKYLRRSINLFKYSNRYYSIRSYSLFNNKQLISRNNYPLSINIYQRRNIFVQISKTPNVLSLKFIPTGHSILPKSSDNTITTLDISSYKDAISKSGLARELFVIDGIKNVFMTTEYITVTVDDTSKWSDIQGQVVGIINDYLMSNKSILESSFNINNNKDGDDDDDDEVIAIIHELLDTRIRPNVQYDGGDVVFKGFDHDSGKLTLQLVGACKGCESSAETLHNGIERMLRFYVPEVSYVEEFVDDETENLKNINQAALDRVQQKLDKDNQSPSVQS